MEEVGESTIAPFEPVVALRLKRSPCSTLTFKVAF